MARTTAAEQAIANGGLDSDVTVSELKEELADRLPGATIDLEPEQEILTVNMGPHHPATHGVLRLVVELEGEVVRDLKPVVGYVHTGIEKVLEGHPLRGADVLPGLLL